MTLTGHRIYLALAAAWVLLGGCTTTTVRSIDMTPPAEMSTDVAEDELLDIGILLFDPNVAETFEERDQLAMVPEVRDAEAAYMPWVMKGVLESTGNWGAVRLMPRASSAVDLTIDARIDHSTGERLDLHVQVVDSTGVKWIDKAYTAKPTKYLRIYLKGCPDHKEKPVRFKLIYRNEGKTISEIYEYYNSELKFRGTDDMPPS